MREGGGRAAARLLAAGAGLFGLVAGAYDWWVSDMVWAEVGADFATAAPGYASALFLLAAAALSAALVLALNEGPRRDALA